MAFGMAIRTSSYIFMNCFYTCKLGLLYVASSLSTMVQRYVLQYVITTDAGKHTRRTQFIILLVALSLHCMIQLLRKVIYKVGLSFVIYNRIYVVYGIPAKNDNYYSRVPSVSFDLYISVSVHWCTYLILPLG